METLPVEMIELILCSKSLSITDVVNFSLTNRYNNLLVTNISDIIWKKKCFKIYPQLAELFKNNSTDINWYAEVRYICDLQQRTREMLSSMSARFFKSYVLSKSDFIEWFQLCEEKPQTYCYLIEYLTNIVNTHVPIETIEVVPITTPGNKTLQHYAMKVLRCLRQLHLAKELEAFMALPPKLQTLEKGIAFIAQWFQPNCVWWSCKNIALELDELTEEIKVNLKRAHPNHPLFVVPKEQLKMWKNENIDCDQYDVLRCEQIKCAMADVIKYQFGGLCTFNKIFVAVKLLEKTIGLASRAILLIIYESVGRRLGVKYEPIVRPTGLYLRASEGLLCRYIDFDYCYYGKGEPIPTAMNYPAATTQQVVKCIARQVQVSSRSSPFLQNMVTVEKMRSALELRELVSPFDVAIKEELTQFYIDYNIDSTSYIEALMQQRNLAPRQIERFIDMLQEYEAHSRNHTNPYQKVERPKVRPPNLKYAVGMVMQCSLRGASPLCVICDWSPYDFYSNREPYYNVLFKEGSYKNVGQGALMIPPRFRSSSDLLNLDFKDIGWGFSHRFEAVFVPNAEKEREYPTDAAVRNFYNEEIKPWNLLCLLDIYL